MGGVSRKKGTDLHLEQNAKGAGGRSSGAEKEGGETT